MYTAQDFACWVIKKKCHLEIFFFIKINVFKKFLSGIPSMSNSLYPDQVDVLYVLTNY